MLNQPWWYWAMFIAVVLLIGAVPLAFKLEQRQDKRDRELWERRWGR